MKDYTQPAYDEHEVAYEELSEYLGWYAKKWYDECKYKDASLKNSSVREKQHRDYAVALLKYIVTIVEDNDIEKNDEVLGIFYEYGQNAPSNWKIDVSDAISMVGRFMNELEDVKYQVKTAFDKLDEIYSQLDAYKEYGEDADFDSIVSQYEDVYSDVSDFIDTYSVKSSISIDY